MPPLMLALLLLCLPLSLAKLHETRSHLPPAYTRHPTPPDPSSLLPTPLRFFLLQSNLAHGPEKLMNVSSPSSPFFRKHWTTEQVNDFFRPSEESALAVERWLLDSGVEKERVRRSKSGGSVDVLGLSVGRAQELLNTTYALYTHEARDGQHLGVREYHLPEEVAEHVDFVYPTLQFDGHATRHGKLVPLSPEQTERAELAKKEKRDRVGLGEPGSGNLPKQGQQVGEDQLGGNTTSGISVCGEFIVPPCLERLYSFPPPDPSAQAVYGTNHLGIVEYTPQSYLPQDLDQFFAFYAPYLLGTRPTLYSIDGGSLQTSYGGFDYQGESDLDLQYAMALSWPEVPGLYQVGDWSNEASFGNFLDGVDGSYCAFEGGDDPTVDEIFPSPGYDHPEDCGTVPKTTVISTSYGYNEYDLPYSYMRRQCDEYLKLGLQGVTVVFSSGDYGVGGNMGGLCVDRSTGYYDYEGTMFTPSFPSTCPWVLSVGATQIPPYATDPFGQPEVACEEVITSGGGFSNVFPRPAYQDSAVSSYLSNHGPSTESKLDYSMGEVRAYPDLSANGANYLVSVDGGLTLVYGTSASAPVVASLIAKINSALEGQGNAPVGFINPVIYANPDRINDITSGSNPGCGTGGFNTAPGWDPVTGVGTLNYAKLHDFYMRLG